MQRDRAGKGKAKAALKAAWYRRFGYREEDAWHHRCQSCGRPLSERFTDYSHKVPAGRGGDSEGVTAENGIVSCRPCHDWLERSPEAQEAREMLIAHSVSLENNEVMEWGPLQSKLWAWVRRWSA